MTRNATFARWQADVDTATRARRALADIVRDRPRSPLVTALATLIARADLRAAAAAVTIANAGRTPHNRPFRQPSK